MIFVSTFDKKTLALHLDPNSTSFETLKVTIRQKTGIPINLQRLFISPRRLIGENSRTLTDLGIKLNSLISLHVPLLGGMQCPVEDHTEADAVFEFDKWMKSRRKDQREARLIEEIEKYRASNPGIRKQIFADLKRKLSTVSDLTAVGEGRGTFLSLKSDMHNNSDSVSGLNVVDHKIMEITSDAKISDIDKVRLRLESVTQKYPKYTRGWIAASRLEEYEGNIQSARQLIQKGCEECPKDENIWLEACRLYSSPDEEGEEAKAVIAKGVKAIPYSVKLWMQAAKLETDYGNKSRVLRKGIEHNPHSVRLWKAVVGVTNNEEDARLLLQRAVECCPLDIELWLALARSETYCNARKVLNKAREKFTKEPAIWITAAKLEEANENIAMVGTIIEKSIRSLQREGLEIDREVWMKEAEAAEREGSVASCQAIIRNVIGVGVEEEDRKRIWVADAEEFKKRGSIESARAVYAHALTVFSTEKSIWLKAAQLEKSHGTMDSLDALLLKAVTYMPQDEALWLMGAILKKPVVALVEDESSAETGKN